MPDSPGLAMAPDLDHAPAVAAFDLDGTLTARGSVVAWLTAIAGAGPVRRALARRLVPLASGALRSGRAADAVKQSLFGAILAGRDAATVEAISVAFADEHLAKHARPEIVARMVDHLDLGHAVVVVSASPRLYVARIAAALGAHGVAATELEVDDQGRLTGRYEGRNCRGAEKLRKVEAVLQDLGAGDTGPDRPLYAYGNSRGDLRLLEFADRPVDVSRLGRMGRLRRYPRLDEVPLG